jgi:hypothetical protein
VRVVLTVFLAVACCGQEATDATARRNENVAIYQIDTNAIKEAIIRVGTTTTIVPEGSVETTYFATEHGRPPGEAFLLAPPKASAGHHGELYWWHQNSVFNARTFFQVGDVMPSHRNGYSGRYTGSLGKLGTLTMNAAQTKIRGMVNGNVLVPLASERTPLTTDPETAAMVSKFLAAYPAELPNRTDFDPRALNTNSPQLSDETRMDARLDRDLGSKSRIAAFYGRSRQRIEAFQLVAGQNPDTEIHTHRARLAWRRTFSAGSELAIAANFQRAKSVLLPEPNAVGPRVRFGYQIEELGPDSQFPIDRAQNTFNYGAVFSRQVAGGRHSVTVGGDLYRYQLNGIETSNQRGQYQFGNNFGRTAIENLRYGTPNFYEVTIGELARGYRNWSADVFVADRWRVRPNLQIYYGLRYSLETAPTEADSIDVIAYKCDCNNFSPRLSLAYTAGWGWVARASYSLSFGLIPPVTYQQVRNNPPYVRYIQVSNPDLVDPLQGIDLGDKNGRYSPTLLSPDLVDSYSHQYNLALERRLVGRSLLRVGYVGSHSLKLPNAFVMNRAEPVPGIPLITATVDQRRPDPRYYEVKHIVSGGIAYFDAGQVSFELPSTRGLALGVTYTFSKGIDEGVDYSSTAANADLMKLRSQWQYESVGDKRGLSNFDSTHSVSAYYAYDLPRPALLGWLLSGWQISGATLVKTGTPLTLYIGSDAPGFGNVDGSASDRPNILDASILGRTLSSPEVSMELISRDRFAFIRPGERRGSLGRNTFRKAGIANFNTALSREWHRVNGHDWTALLRIEAYNAMNHPQFDEPQRNLSASSFGRITNTLNDGRVFQIGLRFIL